MTASTPSAVQQEIARIACHEIQDLADMLRETMEDRGESSVSHIVRGTLMRIITLSDAIHDAVIVDEPENDADDLLRIVGCRVAAEVAKP